MGDFIIDANDGNFIIESGSSAVPVFKVSGSQTLISGSLIPGEAFSGSAISELGSEDHPWKELYVESASINFVKTQVATGDSDRIVKFSRDDVEDLVAGRPPRGVKPLSRFSNTYGFNVRATTQDARMFKSTMRAGGSGIMTQNLGTSNINGTTTSAAKAFNGSSFIAPQACQVNAITVACNNPTNTDNLVIEIFKATLVNDSSAAVTLTLVKQFAIAIGATNKTYLASSNLTSANTLNAGDSLMVVIHIPSLSGTSFPNAVVTIDGQYR